MALNEKAQQSNQIELALIYILLPESLVKVLITEVPTIMLYSNAGY